MRVAVISPYGPGWMGGISSYVTSLAASLRERGVECTTLVHEGGRNEHVVELRGPKPWFVAQAVRWLLAHDAEVVHAHSHWYTLLPAILYKAIRPGTRVVFSLHTPPAPARPIARAVMRCLMHRCDIVTAVSRDILAALGVPEPGSPSRVVIPPGARVGLVDFEGARSRLGVRRDQFVVTSVSVLVWPEKAAGARLLVRAFQRFAHGRTDCRLFVVGGGPHLASLREMVSRLSPEGEVSLLGETPNPAPFVQACDVYAQVSYKEGVPLAMLDAMGAGKAVVASKVGGIPEVLTDGESGVLVNNEETEIAQALDVLYRDRSLRNRLGAAASRLVRSEYTWDKVADRFLEVYRGRRGA